MEIKYSQEQIQKVLDILNTIELKGAINMTRILNIIKILDEPFRDNKNKEI